MKTRPITDLFDACSGAVEPPDILRDYHYRRIDRVNDGEYEIDENKKGIILVHISLADFFGPYLDDRIDAAEFVESSTEIPIIKRASYSNFSDRVSLCSRGVKASKSVNNNVTACTWIDRTGVLEAISTDLVYEQENQGPIISTETLERTLSELITSYLETVVESDDDLIFATISYLNMDGVYTPRMGSFDRPREIETPFIETPVVTIRNENIRKQLTPLLRPFWQAVNYFESPYMTEDGWEFED
ncbi:hypothetical protein [Natronococcus roseus]|uniref:hypothetical protein n=1 Tax=Natronococcus roseus TaxID=1052014 RepID=UPI00374CEB0B